MAEELGQAFIEIRANLESLASDLAAAQAETRTATQALQAEVQRMSDQMNQSMRSVQNSTDQMANRFQSGSNRVSESTRQISNALRAADQQFNQKFKELGQNMQQFGTDTEGLISTVSRLGTEQKKAADQMINSNTALRGELLQTIGTVLARSNSMDKVAESIKRQGEAIHALSGPFMAVGSALENMAKQGNVAVVALRELGPQATNKQLLDMIGVINQGLMRFQSVAMLSAVAAGGMIVALVKLSNEVDGRLIPAGEQFKETWLKALEPLAKAVTEFFLVIIKAGTAVGDFMNKVKETSPILAGMITGFVALAPVIALVLSPLAVGVSTLGSFRAAFTAVFMMIKPFVTGFLTIAGPVILVTGLIVTLIGFFTKLTKESEAFRSAVTNAWNQVKAAAQAAFAPIAPLINSMKTAFMNMVSGITGAAPGVTGVWDAIGQVVANFVNNFVNAAMPAIKTAFQIAAEAIKLGINILITAFNMISDFWAKHGPMIKQIVTEVFQTVGTVVTNAGQIIQTIFGFILAAIKPVLPLLATLAQTFIEALAKVAGALTGGKQDVSSFSENVQTIFNFLKSTVVPIIGEAFKVASQIVQTAVKIITDAVTLMGDLISNAVKLLSAVMQGDWKAAWEAIKAINTAAGEFIIKTLTNLFNLLKNTIIGKAMTEIVAKIKTGWTNIQNDTTAKINALKTFLSGAWNAIKSTAINAWNSIKTSVSNSINSLKTQATNNFNSMKNAIMGVWNGLKSSIPNAANNIKSKVQSAFRSLAGSMSGIWSGFVSGIKGALNQGIRALNKFIAGVNKAIAKLNKAPGVNLSTVPSIPLLAKGGNILSAGLSIVGERGPELLNLPRGARVSPLGSNGGDVEAMRGRAIQLIQNIQAKATPQDLQLYTERALRKIASQAGLIF